MPKRNIKKETDIRLPLRFIVFALIAFVSSQLILFANTTELLESQFRIPKIWMSAHFLLLGFAVMVAMGAMYQLVPVAFLTPIWNQKFGFIQFYTTAIGITTFALMLGYKTNIAIYGASLTVIGILMFLFQMMKTLKGLDLANRTAIFHFVKTALICFLLTIFAGLLLAHNLAYGTYFNHIPLLLSHITLGVSGWFTLLIMGMSYKLVPMFSLSHGHKSRWMNVAFISFIVGISILVISYWLDHLHLRTLGLLFMLVGFSFYFYDMREIYIKRMKRKLDDPFKFAIVSMVNGLIIHVLAFLTALFGINAVEVWAWIIYLYIMTWVIFSILGYLYKVVPFLWWTYKYSDRAGKEKVPVLRDLLNVNFGTILYALFPVSVLGVVVSIAFQSGILAFIFFGLLALVSLLYALSILWIFFK